MVGSLARKIESLVARRDAMVRWLFVALAACAAVHLLILFVLLAQGESIRTAIYQLPVGDLLSMRGWVWIDSWWPMLKACDQYVQHPHENMYSVFAQGVKFQYPPSSLLACELLPDSWRAAPEDRRLHEGLLVVLSWLSRLAVVGTWLVAAWLAVVARERLSDSRTQLTAIDRGLVVLLALPLAATFYPVVHPYRLGQVQVFLNAGVGVALLAFLYERRALAGAVLAACTLIKPQFGMVLVWSLWRRERRFSAGYGICFAIGLAASIWRFGIANHLAYLEVLREIARLGESAYANQSVNGLLNRMLGNGVVVPPPGVFQSDFAPYHAGIHAATTATSILILLLAFEPWKLRRESRGLLDLTIVLAAATMAAPVAWNHHYGMFLHVFALALPVVIQWAPGARFKGVVLGTSFVLIGFEFISLEWFVQTSWRVLLFSHVFFGATLLFALLLGLRSALTSSATEAELAPLWRRSAGKRTASTPTS
jgi:hypothetical protein